MAQYKKISLYFRGKFEERHEATDGMNELVCLIEKSYLVTNDLMNFRAADLFRAHPLFKFAHQLIREHQEREGITRNQVSQTVTGLDNVLCLIYDNLEAKALQNGVYVLESSTLEGEFYDMLNAGAIH